MGDRDRDWRRHHHDRDRIVIGITTDLTFVFFTLGIVGTGPLAVPVLAGSAAYCVSEAFGWPATLQAKAQDAVGFYGIIAGATVVGLVVVYLNSVSF